MQFRRDSVASLLLLCCLAGAAKDKKKPLLPEDVLRARTVLVVVDPEAGVSVQDPFANRKAQEDVEKALLKWGRFSLAMDAGNADLLITVRKGSGKIVDPTIGGVPTNNRPVIFEPNSSGGRVGGRTGNPGNIGDPSSLGDPSGRPSQQVEMGQPQDTFVVYRSSRDNPLDYPPVWRYSAKDALQSPGVPAVEAFRKLIVETEKQQAAKP